MALTHHKGELMSDPAKPLIPWSWPWRDKQGEPLRPLQLFLNRKFTLSYIGIVWLIWLLPSLGPEHNCYIPDSGFDCSGGLWPSDLVNAPLTFLTTMSVMFLYHNTLVHILFVTTGFIIFVQSFETRENALSTLSVFLATTFIAAILVSLGMNLGSTIWPKSELLSAGMGRNWMGGSAGFYGVIGAAAHHSRIVWFVPLLIAIFEVWNHLGNDISLFTSMAHMIAMAAGFIIWSRWNRNPSPTA